MTITLPDELREPLERKARAAGFATVAEYLCRLVEEDIEEDEITPAELGFASAGQLEAKLEAALDSGPPIPVTPAFWDDHKRRVNERMAKRAAGCE
jgi:hypothetical protein